MRTWFLQAGMVGLLLGVITFWLPALADENPAKPTKVLEIKGKKLVLYSQAEATDKRMIARKDLSLPLAIKDISPKGRFLVEIDGTDYWILKAQAITDEVSAGPPVNCQSLTTSFASSRGFSDCKK